MDSLDFTDVSTGDLLQLLVNIEADPEIVTLELEPFSRAEIVGIIALNAIVELQRRAFLKPAIQKLIAEGRANGPVPASLLH